MATRMWVMAMLAALAPTSPELRFSPARAPRPEPGRTEEDEERIAAAEAKRERRAAKRRALGL